MATNEISVPDAVEIWHYTPFAAFVSILQRRKLWFTRLDRLADPTEGTSEHPYKSEFMKRSEEFTRKGFAHCWYIDDCESDVMWRAFGGSFGVAIQSTVLRLRTSFNGPEKAQVRIRAVQYGTDWSAGPPESRAFLKRKHFAGERAGTSHSNYISH